MNLRMASQNDMDMLVRVRFDYFAAEKWRLSPEQKGAMAIKLREYYARHLGENFYASFAEVDGNIVSVAFLAITEKPANLSWPTGRIGTLLNVLTYSPHRKKGYATCVLNMIINEARRYDLSFIELAASGPAQSIYRKLGFSEAKSLHSTNMRLYLY